MKSPIKVHPPVIQYCCNGLRVQCQIEGAHADTIWFQIDQDPGVVRVEQIADAFVLPAVIGAMALGYDVDFGFPVSEALLLNLRTALLPLLLHLHPDLFPHAIEIRAEGVMRVPSIAGRGSATGLSCGLDSLAAVNSLLNLPISHSMTLTAAAFFDVGNHDPLHTCENSSLFAARAVNVRNCSSEMKLPLYVVQSNVGDWFPGVFARLHTLRNASAAFLLAPRVRHYVYANAVPIWAAKFSSADSAYADLVLLPLLSTEALTFHSGTPALDSVGKTRLIADMPSAQRHLDVCLFEGHNCSRCEKCLRRMLALDIVGALQKFTLVFDLERFAQVRSWYVGYVLTYSSRKESLRELADAMRRTHYAGAHQTAYRACWWIERLRRWIRRRLRLPVDKF